MGAVDQITREHGKNVLNLAATQNEPLTLGLAWPFVSYDNPDSNPDTCISDVTRERRETRLQAPKT